MKDLAYEQKGSLSRLEAADRLAALAAALREGGEADLEWGPGRLTLRIPEELHSEIEVEVEDGEIELEIEFRWPAGGSRRAAAPERAAREEEDGSAGGGAAPRRRSSAAARSARGTAGAARSKGAKRASGKSG
ncbi:amphi-Trp domain-containing protein [Streptomyces genisteinicus]|uniref:Amphi-Trp domain-containing protein n=1 Tax=Streptomyces genisteinicus TaxID=2768068 RepID=A0A7H0HRY7_9ACTN|nr:amphi-Trp domain-containing protein [Streptomyces genisteinicus]QNP63303.1 amphi-Trp domain-containing protein [Streptomyces genisteinicus]